VQFEGQLVAFGVAGGGGVGGAGFAGRTAKVRLTSPFARTSVGTPLTVPVATEDTSPIGCPRSQSVAPVLVPAATCTTVTVMVSRVHLDWSIMSLIDRSTAGLFLRGTEVDLQLSAANQFKHS
jgi:hypothetical protein